MLSAFVFGTSWQDYLKNMMDEHQWGDHIMLHGLSIALQRQILVISSIGNTVTIGKESKKQPLVIGHVAEYHYVSLRMSKSSG